MSVAFSSARPGSKGEMTPQTIQKMLDENHHLIQCIMDYQSKGKTAECAQYQQILHRNLVYLATIADSNQNMQSLLPAPPSSNMSMDPGRMSQSGRNTPSNLNDILGPGLPSTSMMQSQMSNGPSHAPMQSGHMQTAIPSTSSYSSSGSGYSHATPSSQGSLTQGSGPGYGSSSSSSSTPSSSSSSSRSNLNMQSSQVSMMHQQSATPHYSSAHSGGQHYQGQQAMGMMGQASQGNSMPQRPMGSYRSSQQGPAQHYMGQDEFYGEQYGHTQSSTEPINQQYYTDGLGEYSYQQSSYGEQGYDRSFDESSPHYYEGGNSQCSQQQASYQQSSGQQPSFSQQQYSSQQGYSRQPHGYGPSQGGSIQFSQYPQSQSQQYGNYRSSQGGPGAQTQRPYTYEQGQYGNY